MLSWAIVLTLTTAIVCQFVQHTDSIFPLLYFTVDSALFAVVVAGTALARPHCPRLPGLRIASAVSVLLAALVFAAVIAPASATGTWVQPYDDYWVRAATFLFHLVGPILVTADFITTDLRGMSLRAVVARCFIWPLSYLIILTGLSVLGVIDLPYPFLVPAKVGWPTVVVAIVSLAVLIPLLATVLYALNRCIRAARPERVPTSGTR